MTINRSMEYKRNGFSVRCIFDEGVPRVTTSPVKGITLDSAISGGEILNEGASAVTDRGLVLGTSPGPTLEENDGIIADMTGENVFEIELTGLIPGTTYYLRAYAVNDQGTGYGMEYIFKTFNDQITDIEGNSYYTIIIGDQEWMAENLKTGKYSDGEVIDFPETNAEWVANTDGAYGWYENDAGNKDVYGALYNWHAVNSSRGLCPVGWYVPGDENWKEPEIYIGMDPVEADDTGYRGTNEGGMLKATGTDYWESPNNGATNESGFTALPGGHRDHSGIFYSSAYEAWFWTSTEDEIYPFSRYLYYWDTGISRYNYYEKNYGMSVRCIKAE